MHGGHSQTAGEGRELGSAQETRDSAGAEQGRNGDRQGGVASEPPRGERRRTRALQLSSVQEKP